MLCRSSVPDAQKSIQNPAVVLRFKGFQVFKGFLEIKALEHNINYLFGHCQRVQVAHRRCGEAGRPRSSEEVAQRGPLNETTIGISGSGSCTDFLNY